MVRAGYSYSWSAEMYETCFGVFVTYTVKLAICCSNVSRLLWIRPNSSSGWSCHPTRQTLRNQKRQSENKASRKVTLANQLKSMYNSLQWESFHSHMAKSISGHSYGYGQLCMVHYFNYWAVVDRITKEPCVRPALGLSMQLVVKEITAFIGYPLTAR